MLSRELGSSNEVSSSMGSAAVYGEKCQNRSWRLFPVLPRERVAEGAGCKPGLNDVIGRRRAGHHCLKEGNDWQALALYVVGSYSAHSLQVARNGGCIRAVNANSNWQGRSSSFWGKLLLRVPDTQHATGSTHSRSCSFGAESKWRNRPCR